MVGSSALWPPLTYVHWPQIEVSSTFLIAVPFILFVLIFSPYTISIHVFARNYLALTSAFPMIFPHLHLPTAAHQDLAAEALSQDTERLEIDITLGAGWTDGAFCAIYGF